MSTALQFEGLGIEFEAEELEAFDAVVAELSDPKIGVPESAVRPREVAIVTLVSKCRVDKAVEKYKAMLAVLDEYGLAVGSLYESEAELRAKLGAKWKSNFCVCGTDKEGRGIMMVNGREKNMPEQEQIVIQAGKHTPRSLLMRDRDAVLPCSALRPAHPAAGVHLLC